MSGKEDCRKELDATFNRLEREISRAFRANENYNEELEKRISQLSLSMNERKAESALREDHPLLAHYSAAQKNMENNFDNWLKNLAQSQKNRLFRNKFNESMLVYVYGKVKSGKSSLGNFVAYGKHDPAPDDINSQPMIEFDVEEISDADAEKREKLEKQKLRMHQERKFLVDFFEATACIQYFKRPGFTWVDSPGIHSTTDKNGKLAGEYLESADLVIYAMSGRSSARDSDREEIREIIKSGKKLLLLITRCDETGKDEDENTGEIISVLKIFSPSDMAEVKAVSIQAILDELNGDACDLISQDLQKNTIALSVKFAEEHPDEPGWSESGMAEFYKVLGQIAESEGVRLKMQAPVRAALDHIRQMEEDAAKLKSELENVNSEIKKSIAELEHQSRSIAVNDGRELAYKIVSLAKANKGDDKRFQEQMLAACEEGLEKSSGKLARIVARNAVNLTANLQNATIDVASLPTFQDIYQTITYHSTTKKRRGSLLGALVGGAIGFAVGGPAVAAIGAGVGATGGGAIGSAMDGSRSEKIKVGDNSLEVGQQAAQKASEWLEQTIEQYSSSIKDACMEPLQHWLENTRKDLNLFETFLQTKKHNLTGELQHEA